jgi:ADP-ribose pyrophosphatase YjhB (NUDIX family)
VTKQQKKPTLSVDLLVLNERHQVLLGKVTEAWRENDQYLWGLPGREVNFGENLAHCAVRTLREETGMLLISLEIKCVNSNFGFDNHYVAVGIVVNANGVPRVTQPNDWEEWHWFDMKSLPDKLFPSAKATLEAFLAGVVSVDRV